MCLLLGPADDLRRLLAPEVVAALEQLIDERVAARAGMPETVTVAEASRISGLTEKAIRRAIERGDLTRIGNSRVRVRLDELEKL